MPNDQHHSHKYSDFMLHANHETISHSEATKMKEIFIKFPLCVSAFGVSVLHFNEFENDRIP